MEKLNESDCYICFYRHHLLKEKFESDQKEILGELGV